MRTFAKDISEKYERYGEALMMAGLLLDIVHRKGETACRAPARGAYGYPVPACVRARSQWEGGGDGTARF